MDNIILTIRGCTVLTNRFQSWLKNKRFESRHGHFLITLSILMLVLISCSRPSQPVSSTSGIDYTTVEMWASSDCVQPGEHVKLRATVTNKGPNLVIYDLPDQPVLDIVLGNPGRVISRWSEGKPLTPDLTRLELEPGQSKTIEMDWTPDPSIQGNVSVAAHFTYSTKFPSHLPGFTIGVKYCTGPLGP